MVTLAGIPETVQSKYHIYGSAIRAKFVPDAEARTDWIELADKRRIPLLAFAHTDVRLEVASEAKTGESEAA